MLILNPARPNPFNPRTEISFSLPRSGPVEMSMYDLAGRRVRELVAGETLTAGTHRRIWDGLDNRGQQVASGVYIVRLKWDDKQRVRRVTLLK